MAKKKQTGELGQSPFYPMVGFYFVVTFDDISNSTDSKFREVSGISMETEGGEQIKEGGQNMFTYHLPGRTKYNDLELKRGMLSTKSDLADWCKESIQNDYTTKIKLRDVYVKLMNEKGQAVMTWQFYNAYPKKMDVSGFNSTSTGDGSIVVQSITLAYEYFDTITV
ncbi:MAG: phage tail protein [Bacteroidota bacterium]